VLDLTRAGGLTCALGPAAILDAPSLAQRLVHVRVLRLPAGPDAPLEALRAVLRLLRDKTLSGSLTLHLADTRCCSAASADDDVTFLFLAANASMCATSV
jgi:hypothetical protein